MLPSATTKTSGATSKPDHLLEEDLHLIYSHFCYRIATDFTNGRADVLLGGGQPNRFFVSFLGRRQKARAVLE
jgi:hypothetical protein